MDWLDRMNTVIDYVEGHLDSEIDYKMIGRVAGCSVFHLQRMFTFIADLPLNEYIRRRRLTNAAFELNHTDCKVIDVALKYGYESSESFSRAFKKMHGISPSGAKKPGATLKAYPKISFTISIKGDAVMNYRIEQKGPFTAFGFATEIPLANGQNLVQIPKMWSDRWSDGSCLKLIEDAKASGIVLDGGSGPNAALYDFTETEIRYMICLITSGKAPEGYEALSIPALTWAIFPTETHTMEGTAEAIQKVWKEIYPQWFQESGYEHANAPEFEMYYCHEGEKRHSEVWIPVTKK